MNIGILLPSIYASTTRYCDMIFAPRNLCIELADGLVQKGHRVFLFTSGDIETKATVVSGESLLLDENIRILTGKDMFLSERMKWASFYATKRYFELDMTSRCYAMARDHKLDIVHSYHDTAAHFFEESTGVSTVYTLHDPIPPKKDKISHWLLSRFFSHAYVAISNAFRNSDDIGLNFVDTVYHGVVCPEESTGESKEKRIYVATVSRMTKEKGVDHAIQAAETVNMPLQIATSLSEANKNSSYYIDSVRPYLSRSVKIQQFKTKNDMWKFYLYAFALLFPIHWEEPFGMVMIESMACGTPVVAYARGSVPEIIVDGVTGFVVNESEENRRGDWIIKKSGVEGLAEAINRLKMMPEGEYRAMRDACRKHVEEKFTVEKMVDGYERVYEKVLAQKSKL